jgi:hypothetical protein
MRTFCGINELARRVGRDVKTVNAILERDRIQPDAMLVAAQKNCLLFDFERLPELRLKLSHPEARIQ